MTENVTITLTADDSQAQAKVSELQQKIDQQQQEWALIRRETIQQMNEINRGINMTIQAVRLTARYTGQALDPVFNSLLTLVSSTVSLVIATATMIAASSLGILAGVALTLAAAAYAYQLGQTARLIADSEEIKEKFARVDAQLADLGRSL